MKEPLLIPDNFSPVVEGGPVSQLDWTFSPTRLHLYWKMNDPLPPAFILNIKHPAYDNLPQYADYTDWKFEWNVSNSFPVQVIQVNETFTGSIDLGDLEPGGLYRALDVSVLSVNHWVVGTGTWLSIVNFKVVAKNPDGLWEIISAKSFTVDLFIRPSWATPPLLVTYPGDNIRNGPQRIPLTFIHTLGTPIPTQKIIHCFPGFTEIEAESSDPLLQVNVDGVDQNFKTIRVDFTSGIEEFEVGEYSYTVTIKSIIGAQITTVLINVLLKVIAESLLEFTIIPEELNFDVITGSVPPPPQVVGLFTLSSWAVTGILPTWLTLSKLTGNGTDTVAVIPQNYDDLPAGQYQFDVTFQNEDGLASLPVTMNLSRFIESVFKKDQIYFTEELEFINFRSQTPDTFVMITMHVKTYEINTNVPSEATSTYNLPLFQGKGEFHPGTVVHQLLSNANDLESYIPDVNGNYAKPQQQPAEVTISYIEKKYDGEELTVGSIPVFKMVRGNKPFSTQSQLCLLTEAQQDMTRITPTSVIGISFIHTGTPRVIVRRNAQVIDDFQLTFFGSNVQKSVFSYYRFNNEFAPGDVVEISISNLNEIRTQRYQVFFPGLESTFFLFQNSNGQIEPFEFTGRRRIFSNFKHITTSKFEKLHAFDTKVASANNLQSMTVNTGQLSKTDHKIVSALIKSENVWCSLDNASGPYLKVDASTTKLTNQDTSVNEEGFDVEFNILENANVTIYPY